MVIVVGRLEFSYLHIWIEIEDIVVLRIDGIHRLIAGLWTRVVAI